ncbi:MAG: hypothetical protein EBY60_01390 [Actinobacteria bacterium]|nr:hypothetical protein [Actinomycetota bacterium]
MSLKADSMPAPPDPSPCYRQCLAGSIQDAAAIGRDLQSSQPLAERGIRKSLASYRLEVH